ncbi:hypothetical protein ONZ45_g9935 [Pleurotus djamor]|nr:hypothetical protein ONZ45_g9935 [Pleurotus djamor]
MNDHPRFRNSRAYLHALVAFWGMILFGYDTGVAGGVVANDYFREYFELTHNGIADQKRIDSVTSNVVSVLQAGAFFAKIGRLKTLFIFTLIFIVGAILTTVASGPSGLAEIYAGRVISGVGIGGISAVGPTYISECAPKEARGRITGIFQIMVVVGVMFSYFVNYGISLHIHGGTQVWKIPFGIQLIPAGLMCIGLLSLKESPRWLTSVGRTQEAISNLAYLRKRPINSYDVIHEMAEIEATIEEERAVRKDLGLREAFLGKGNFIRFFLAFASFLLQQFSGQTSINYYAPRIFESIGYTGNSSSLLASGIYGVLKVVGTLILVFILVDSVGRKPPFIVSAIGMGIVFFITGAILKTHPPPSPGDAVSATPSASGQAMAAMIYLFVIFYAVGWGGLPWIYSSEIFPTRTRHYGLAVASSSQWLWNFVISKATPSMLSALGYKIFFFFGAINMGALLAFSVLIPETRGRSLEDMDVVFGSVSAEQRRATILQREQGIFDESSSS